MTASQIEKANRLRALHENCFVIANAWDAGSARILASLGFQALATSSGASAGILGRRDGGVAREEALAQARGIVEAVDIPVSADLENGFADDPAGVAETARGAVAAGLAGFSIEDFAPGQDEPIYPLSLAAERVAAAAEVAHGGDAHVVLTARCENFLHGRRGLDDTIERLRVYQQADQATFMLLHDGRVYFDGTAEDLQHANDPYLKEFLFMTLPPW